MATPDFYGMLSSLGDTLQQNQLKATRDRTLAQLGQGDGAVDYNAAARALLPIDPHTALALAHLGQQQQLTSPEYIENIARTKAKVEQEFAPKTVDIKRAGPLGDTVTETMERGPNGIRPLNVAPGAQSAPSPGAPASNALTGDEYLNTLPPQAASIVKKLANHEITPTMLSVKGGHREQLMAAASQYDPNYDAALAPARFAAIKEFNSGGPNAPASVIVAGNTAIQHLKTLSDSAQKIGGFSSLGPLNSLGNQANVMYQGAKNNPDLAEYRNALGRFAEEATKFYRGVGGAEADIKRALDEITAAQSPEARNRAIATQADLMQSKINAMQDRWKQATGPAGWKKVSADFPIVQKKSIEGLNEILKRDGRAPYQTEAKPQAAAQVPAGAAQALKADPKLRDQFETKYGPGSAAQILGQ